MSLVSLTLPSDGQTAHVADVNTPLNQLATAINGNLDSTNISSLSGTKIQSGTLPSTAFDSTTAGGWISLGSTPNTVVYNGNRSYTLTFNGTDVTSKLSPGARVRLQRATTAPVQSTSLNGTTQYFSKAAPAGMTFTDDFTVSAWIKVNAFSGGNMHIVSRSDGTSGWGLALTTNGQVVLLGFNGALTNVSQVTSVQSVPLNRWVHVSANLDMSAFVTNTDGSATGSCITIDGINVPATVTRGGSNPTALVQAGNLNVGNFNGGAFNFNGKIAQVAVFSSKITNATMITYISQGLAGTETSLISAYSFNNSINDLNTTNANNLSSNGSAVATNADSPFGSQAGGTISNNLEYGIVQSSTFSTNSTVVVQVPEGGAFPTSGGIAAFSYSIAKAPFGMPVQRGKWQVLANYLTQNIVSSGVSNTWYNPGSAQILVPNGEWNVTGVISAQANGTGATTITLIATISTSSSGESDKTATRRAYGDMANAAQAQSFYSETYASLSAPTSYYGLIQVNTSTTTTFVATTSPPGLLLKAENAYL